MFAAVPQGSPDIAAGGACGPVKTYERPVSVLVGICFIPFVFVHLAAMPQSDPARPRYLDVAGRSKFSYVTNNGFTDRKYFPQPLCGGVAVLDFDNDGWLDIFFTNGAKFPELKKVTPSFHHALLRNKRDGTFEDVTQRAGMTGEHLGYSLGVAAGDFDNDGSTDLFIANAGANALYRNNGNGSFQDVTASSGLTKPDGVLSVQGAWFDFDNDGLLDLALSNYTSVDCCDRSTMCARRRCRILLPSENLSCRSAPSIPQSGKR